MPHSLYLGSDVVKARLRHYDLHHVSTTNCESAGDDTHRQTPTSAQAADEAARLYRPSLYAIRSCLSFSIWEVSLSLFTFALFVNSAILIVAGASLSNLPESETEDQDLFSIHRLLSSTLAPAAGTVFALALLLSGTSAGIVCTMAGQIVSEGQLNWRIKPWLRRLVTRGISIIPAVIIAGSIGRSGLSKAIEATQVALSVVLPFVTAPLIWFTCKSSIMSVWTDDDTEEGPSVVKTGTGGNDASNSERKPEDDVDEVQRVRNAGGRFVVMRNHWLTAFFAVIIWLVIVVMNGSLIVLAAMGKG
jgi:metal iron transporter